MSNAIFLILLAILVGSSILGLIDMKKAGKRMDRNTDLWERHIALMEKEMENDNNDNGI